jgi:hypothetical protein
MGDEIEFATIMWFDDRRAIEALVGENAEVAYVLASARMVLARFECTVTPPRWTRRVGQRWSRRHLPPRCSTSPKARKPPVRGDRGLSVEMVAGTRNGLKHTLATVRA